MGLLSKERTVREPHWLFLPGLVRVCQRLRESQHGVLAWAGQACRTHERGRRASHRARDIRGCNFEKKYLFVSFFLSLLSSKNANLYSCVRLFKLILSLLYLRSLSFFLRTLSMLCRTDLLFYYQISGAAYPSKVLTLQGGGPWVSTLHLRLLG